MSADILSTVPPAAAERIRDALTGALASVFQVSVVVSLGGFALSWLIPERPLRRTVAAASSSIGQESADAFAMPASGDSSTELLRGLAILADRDLQRAYVEGIVRSAGVRLSPAAAWLLLRMDGGPAVDLQQVARMEGIPPPTVEEAVSELVDRGYVERSAADLRKFVITAAGCEIHDTLAAARRDRLMQLYADWPAWQRERLASALQRLARELVPPRAA